MNYGYDMPAHRQKVFIVYDNQLDEVNKFLSDKKGNVTKICPISTTSAGGAYIVVDYCV